MSNTTLARILRDEELSIEDLIKAGAGFAVTRDWETVDDIIIPIFEGKLEKRKGYFGYIGLQQKYLRDSHRDIRDYGATLAFHHFKKTKYDGSFVHQSLVAALARVAYEDDSPNARLWASLALIEAARGITDKRYPIDLRPKELFDNLSFKIPSGLIPDKAREYVEIAQKYLSSTQTK